MNCFEVKVNDATINTTSLGTNIWETYRSKEEVGETYSLKGEFITLTGDGFTLDIDP